MDEEKHEKQPTYEELLEFKEKHNRWVEGQLLAIRRRQAVDAERLANLSRTWTGRLVLLADKLNVDWVAVFAFAVLLSVNFWILCYIILGLLY